MSTLENSHAEVPSVVPFVEGNGQQHTTSEPERISNVKRIGQVERPARMEEIIAMILAATGGWPARMGNLLFSPRSGAQGVEWHDSAASFFGWLGDSAGHVPYFKSGGGLHPKTEVYERLAKWLLNFRESSRCRIVLSCQGCTTPVPTIRLDAVVA